VKLGQPKQAYYNQANTAMIDTVEVRDASIG
jgi:hypothetical protein